MIVRRIEPMSCGKMLGITYAAIGVLQGAVFSLIALAGSVLDGHAVHQPYFAKVLPLVFGIGAIVVIPLLTFVIGFVTGLVLSVAYNLAARFAGGIRIDVDTRSFQRD